VGYLAFDGNLELTFGVNNVLDEDPPVCYSCSLNGYDPSIYDVPGRFAYLRVNWHRPGADQ
jgi:iron complex outermembrane receptor protein